MAMSLENRLKVNAEQLDQKIEIILEKWLLEAKTINVSLIPLVTEFIKANKGGKKVRGFLVRLGYELAQKTHLPGVKAHLEGGAEIIKVAAAYEIFHTAILAHDDIMDQDTQRRGQPSLYQALRPKDGQVDGDHYGISQAISLADAGFFIAVKIITEAKFEAKLTNQALSLFSQTMIETSLGQMLDLKKTDPFTVMRLKTAKYTVCAPLQLGALLGGASKDLIKKLAEFGEHLGIAFQIKDDILDGEVGSVEESEKKALEYVSKAKKILPKLTDNKNMRKLLEELVKYMVERNK